MVHESGLLTAVCVVPVLMAAHSLLYNDGIQNSNQGHDATCVTPTFAVVLNLPDPLRYQAGHIITLGLFTGLKPRVPHMSAVLDYANKNFFEPFFHGVVFERPDGTQFVVKLVVCAVVADSPALSLFLGGFFQAGHQCCAQCVTRHCSLRRGCYGCGCIGTYRI